MICRYPGAPRLGILLRFGVCLVLLGGSFEVVQAQVDPILRRNRVVEKEDTLQTDDRPTYLRADPRQYVRGKIVDVDTKEPLVGATVKVKDLPSGAYTDENGEFSIVVPPGRTTTLVVSYIGYDTEIFTVRKGQRIVLELVPGEFEAQEVVVSAGRFTQKIRETPVSISKLSTADLQRSPTVSVYEAINQVKEIEGISVGIGYKLYNARGFLALVNNRFLQRYDGIEMLIPGNNATVGNLVGLPDVDVQNAEVLIGSASVLYGSTAINGLLNITSRNPFDFTGLSFQVRTGVNQLSVNQVFDPARGDSVVPDPAPFFEVGIRYAKRVSDEFAYKFSVSGFTATDWSGVNYSDGAVYRGTTNDIRNSPGLGNPGYDGTNLFGDEIAFNLTFRNFQDIVEGNIAPIPANQDTLVQRVARTGYKETDLADYSFQNLKASFSIHHRYRLGHEFIWSTNVGLINAITPINTRDRLDNFVFQHHKAEWITPSFNFRAYVSLQANPNMVNLTALGVGLNRAYKSDEEWFTQYMAVYNGLQSNQQVNLALLDNGLPAVPRFDDAAARAFADSDNRLLTDNLGAFPQFASFFDEGRARVEPGTPEFNRLVDSLENTSTRDGGARIQDYTGFLNLEGQYKVPMSLDRREFQVGGLVKAYRIQSDASFYADYEGAIFALDYGVYGNYVWRSFSNRWILNGGIRIDGNQSIPVAPSVRGALTYNLDPDGYGFFRMSAQSSARMPNLVQQFQDLNLGVYRQIGTGAASGAVERYNLPGNNYTLSSIQSYTNTLLTGVTDQSLLLPYDFTELKPERITSFEFGFRTVMKPGQTYVDLAYFYNYYERFIGLVPVLGPRDPTQPISVDDAFSFSSSTNYQVWANLPDRFSSFGLSIGAQIQLTDIWNLNGSVSFVNFSRDDASQQIGGLVDLENAPRFKATGSLFGKHFYKKASLGITYRWVDTYFFAVPNFTATIPSFSVLDAALSYDLPNGVQLRVGGTNFLNNYHVELIYGPQIGATYFFQLTYDPNLFQKRSRKPRSN